MDVSPQTLSQQWDAARQERRRVLVDLIASRERVIALYAYRDVPYPARYAQDAERELAIQRERLERNVADLVAFDTVDGSPSPD